MKAMGVPTDITTCNTFLLNAANHGSGATTNNNGGAGGAIVGGGGGGGGVNVGISGGVSGGGGGSGSVGGFVSYGGGGGSKSASPARILALALFMVMPGAPHMTPAIRAALGRAPGGGVGVDESVEALRTIVIRCALDELKLGQVRSWVLF